MFILFLNKIHKQVLSPQYEFCNEVIKAKHFYLIYIKDQWSLYFQSVSQFLCSFS